MASDPSLPSFERPPLNEVVLSVQFEPIAELHAGMMGLFWGTVRDRFPNVQTQGPVDPVVERTGTASRIGVVPTFLSSFPVPRIWLMSSEGNELIQLQQDRFLRNWRQLNESDHYPRYDKHIRPRFIEDYETFLAFLRAEKIPAPVASQCEVSYFNVIEGSPPEQTHARVSSILKIGMTEYDGVDGLSFEDSRLALRHQILGEKGEFLGRLHTVAEPRLKVSDNTPIVSLGLTARGRPLGEGIEGILNFFDLGRRIIVNSFAAITTKEMQSTWGRTDVR